MVCLRSHSQHVVKLKCNPKPSDSTFSVSHQNVFPRKMMHVVADEKKKLGDMDL